MAEGIYLSQSVESQRGDWAWHRQFLVQSLMLNTRVKAVGSSDRYGSDSVCRLPGT